jgi:very-short-patch-repair endonuclease
MQPKVLFNGSKLMCLEIDVGEASYKFIDSHCFMPAKLSALSKMFSLPDSKGYFPHRFNTFENADYDGAFPALEHFEPELLSVGDRDKLKEWHTSECERYAVDPSLTYNLRDEMIKYCVLDVTILRQGCQEFQRLFESMTSVDPFESCITLPSACHRAFRKKWMEPNKIAVIPAGGYSHHRHDSVIAQQWIAWRAFKDSRVYRHARSEGGEKKIDRYFVDGYHEESKTVLEFYGSYYHGDPEVYGGDTFNQKLQCTMGELHAQTLDREEYLKSKGYKVIRIWESEFRKQLQSNTEMREFVEKYKVRSPLQPRDAFAGGRTNTLQLHSVCKPGETIEYADVTSLYPFINKTGKLPVGHPEIIVGRDYKKGTHYGLVYCKMLPPTDLYHPVLWRKSGGKLLFPLCQKCANLRVQDRCEHADHERA